MFAKQNIRLLTASILAVLMLTFCKTKNAEIVHLKTADSVKTINISYGTKSAILTMGRTERPSENRIILIGSASMARFLFAPNTESVSLNLRSLNNEGKYGFVTLELDGQDLGRKKIEAESTFITLNTDSKNKRHILKIYKSTEAANGAIEVFVPENALRTENDLRMYFDDDNEIVEPSGRKKIEFIGNSITCGMGNDLAVPCQTGEWFDQHNAYWAYGAQLARDLGADFQLSSVSGIGMYRNWNDENGQAPTMPDVYGNLYLNKDASKPYDFAFNPDVISICLGTNDLSLGDGKKTRLPFNKEKYINNYVNFIKILYQHNPHALIVLLDSPMVTGSNRILMDKCLDEIKAEFANTSKYKPVQIFHFSDKIIPHGCDYHPDIQDHMQMKNELLPFFKNILYSL